MSVSAQLFELVSTSGWAEGKLSLLPFAINPADPGKITDDAIFQSISLQSLIAASNLAGKVRLEGKISGHIPFAMGPDGIRITKGAIAADGPGRLSVNRSVWAQGDAAINSNAVQDFAYQALENLSFDQLSGEVNSLPMGRLGMLLHIKGRHDPAQAMETRVSVLDLLRGRAFDKPLPLPKGTPIDLTLDTSLNLDELLASYFGSGAAMTPPR